MHFTQRVMLAVASVSLAAAGVLGIGGAQGSTASSTVSGPQPGANSAPTSLTATATSSTLSSATTTATTSSAGWRTAAPGSLLSGRAADVTARPQQRSTREDSGLVQA